MFEWVMAFQKNALTLLLLSMDGQGGVVKEKTPKFEILECNCYHNIKVTTFFIQ